MGKPFRLVTLEPTEQQTQDAILRLLAIHPAVAWAHRFNSGAHVIDDAAVSKAALLDRYIPKLYATKHQPIVFMGILRSFFSQYYEIKAGKPRFIRYAFPGCSDILGQLTNGAFLAIEVKTRTTTTTEEQQAFIDTVNAAGGLGLVARGADEVKASLDCFIPHRRTA